MATIKNTSVTAELKVTLELTESEVRALDGMFGYNPDAFLKAFYEKMGRAYVEPHEKGVRSLHETIGKCMAGPIAAINTARQAVRDAAGK